MDLRERVVAAVESWLVSCHQAAAQFGVGVSTTIVWVRRLRETGSVAPGQMGLRSMLRRPEFHRPALHQAGLSEAAGLDQI